MLAIGTAFVGTFLSLYVDLILRPHPGFERSGRIATIGQSDGVYMRGIPYAIVVRLADEMTSIESAAMSYVDRTLAGPEREDVLFEMVSEGFFDALRPRLEFGSGFRPEDHASEAEPVVVISYRYWQQHFGGDREILGSVVEITPHPVWSDLPNGATTQFRVIGVMSRALPGLAIPDTALWFPLESAYPLIVRERDRLPGVVGPTYVLRRAGTSTASVLSEIGERFFGPDSTLDLRPGLRLDAIDGIARNIDVQRAAKRQLEMFLGGSVLLALVAAANVSLFLIARAPGRRREIGIRLAIGAPIRRIARQLATEAGLLIAASAALGLLFSVWLSQHLRGLAFLRNAEWRSVALLDWRVLGLAAAFLLMLTLLVSLAPILGIGRLGIAGSSRQVTARASPVQRLAGTLQVVVACTFGGAAIASAWYLGALTFGDPGYETANRHVVEFVRDSISSNDLVEIVRRRDAIESIPGVTAVAFGFPVPGEQGATLLAMRVSDPNAPGNEIDAYFGYLEPRLIDMLGLDLAQGRAPEVDEAGVALVNQSLARMVWGREDVVGARLALSAGRDLEVIGVIEDVSFEHPSAAARPYLFGRTAVQPFTVVQAELTAADLRQAIDRIAAAGALDGEVRDVRPLRMMYKTMIAPDIARGLLTMTAAVLVVGLAAFGFYGTQRYLVAAGKREYAIRASLGAGPRAIGRLVIGRSLLLGVPGLAAGGFLVFMVVSWMRDDYLGGKVSTAVVTAVTVAGLALVLLAASLGPAWEARKTQPALLLRED